ncbi:1-acyl-sn-glycerol-3-phosphate acyltransferase [Thermodesulfovibrionales bacterium]|nr:1-acyl-sn-glycerol-3-phosphate acyltransferase [Thermodesulfovibrionales bacterium]
MLTFLYFFMRAILYTIFKVFFLLRVYGLENVPDKGGVIVAANHVSYFDPPVFGVALKRKATYIAKRYLFSVPIISPIVNFYCISVDEGKAQASTIKESVKRLKKGELIVMFPEGERSEDGSFLDAKRGIGLIAAISGAPVVPALVDGTQKVLPVGAKVPRLAKIKVSFGKPLTLRSRDKDLQEKICNDIMNGIKELKKSSPW